jgi:hypothetical protein
MVRRSIPQVPSPPASSASWSCSARSLAVASAASRSVMSSPEPTTPSTFPWASSIGPNRALSIL